MIVVDTSALTAIAKAGARALECMHALHAADRVLMSAANVTEALIVAFGYGCEPQMRALFEHFGIEVVPVTAARAVAAGRSYKRYGKGWHAASLNYGDSFAYALAAEMDCELLFVGNDFGITDIGSVLANPSPD